MEGEHLKWELHRRDMSFSLVSLDGPFNNLNNKLDIMFFIKFIIMMNPTILFFKTVMASLTVRFSLIFSQIKERQISASLLS